MSAKGRQGYSLEILELTRTGPVKETRRFPSYIVLDNFLDRRIGYTYDILKKSRMGKRTDKYIVSSTGEHHRRHGTFYVVLKVNDKEVAGKKEIDAFYQTHSRNGFQEVVKKPKLHRLTKETLEKAHEQKMKRRHLLLTIDVKYGGIDKAEGTPELEEFRELVGAYKIE